MNGTLAGSTTPGQSEPETNGNEGVPHFLQIPGLDLLLQTQICVIPNTLNDFIYCYLTVKLLNFIIHFLLFMLSSIIILYL